LAALLALLAATGYGVGDFLGGLGGRRTHAALIPIPVQVVGALTATVAILTGPGGVPTASALLWGAIGGVGSGVGNATLIRGLAAGRMTVVAPLSAVMTAAVPALVGILAGDRLTAAGWSGIALALPAVALTSWEGKAAGFGLRDIAYGVGAGCGFGLLFVALDHAGADSGAWPLLPGQIVALFIVTAVAVPQINRIRRGEVLLQLSATLRWGAACGVFGASASLLFLFASGAGQLTVVAVLASLYPAVTVVLAAAVLREPIAGTQTVGLLAAAASVLLIVIGW
jgi:drug/metabolite transporter (DMT)-like permease